MPAPPAIPANCVPAAPGSWYNTLFSWQDYFQREQKLMTSHFAPPPSGRMSLPLWHERHAAPLAPMTAAEMNERGWDSVDVVFVTGDAYVDHPSFAMAILARVLESAGFRVAILSQPDWHSCEPWRQFGRPRLFFAVSAGNMDSLINHYTANKKVRNDDAYSPGGKIGLRPDRATLSYCHRAREAFPGVPIIAGGVEASLRRLAHYDYWSDTVRRAILLDCKADLLVYGMGERNIVTIARRLAAGETVKDLRDMRGVAYVLGASETPPLAPLSPWGRGVGGEGVCLLPSFEQVKADKLAFAEATRLIHINTNPLNAKTLVQYHDRQAVVVNPPDLPLSQDEMDAVYDLPYTRRPHPSYREPIPAYEMIKDSVTIMRGCFGGCTFCSITAHQGRIIQSRSQESVLGEVRKMAADPEFAGIISDIGGPTANMYQMRCTRPEVEAKCKRLSCVHPTICKLLGTDHGPLIELMKRARTEPGIRKVLGGQRHSHGPGPAIARISARAGRPSRRRPSEGRPGAHRSARARVDEEAGKRQFRGLRPRLPPGVEGGGQAEAVPGALLHRQPSRLRPARHDRPGRVPQAQRLPPRPGAGLHSGTVRHRHVHVLHRDRSVHEAGGLHRQGACGTARCSGR